MINIEIESRVSTASEFKSIECSYVCAGLLKIKPEPRQIKFSERTDASYKYYPCN